MIQYLANRAVFRRGFDRQTLTKRHFTVALFYVGHFPRPALESEGNEVVHAFAGETNFRAFASRLDICLGKFVLNCLLTDAFCRSSVAAFQLVRLSTTVL